LIESQGLPGALACGAEVAIRAASVQGEVNALHFEGIVQAQVGCGWDRHIEDFTAAVTIKVTVFLHVRAEAGGPAIQCELSNQAAANQGFETVVNRSERDSGHLATRPEEYLLGSGVVAVLDQDSINPLALGRRTQAARG